MSGLAFLTDISNNTSEQQANSLNDDSANQRTLCANAFKMALTGNNIGVTILTKSLAIASDISNS